MNATTSQINLTDQIKSVRREIGMRERVYPNWVRQGKMKADAAEHELAAMRATLATLESLRWIPVTERLPDADTTVMLQMEDGEIWTGWYDDEVEPPIWRYVSADPASGVKAWRAMPE